VQGRRGQSDGAGQDQFAHLAERHATLGLAFDGDHQHLA
jgi:hypothetical protein